MPQSYYISSIFQSYLSDNVLSDILSGASFIQKMLQFESALANCQATLNIIPKDAAEIVLVGKHIFLQRQKHAG